jgi:hypothetical protein
MSSDSGAGQEGISASPNDDDDDGITWFESHHFVYQYCENHYSERIAKGLLALPRQHRKKFFKKRAGGSLMKVSSDDLKAYLETISDLFKPILKNHSPLFWLYLYRRIKPSLHKDHDNLTDETTVLLVRQFAELAIAKYGDLGNTSDLSSAGEITYGECWGGVLRLALEEIPRDARNDWTFVAQESLKKETLIPERFRPADYGSIYAVEGLAYEYWLTTARMRSIGKGAALWFDPVADAFFYEPNKDLVEAMRRYDSRSGSARYFSTLIGMVTGGRLHAPGEDVLIALTHNVGGIDMSPLWRESGFNAKSRDGASLANFVTSTLDIKQFLEGHSFLRENFAKKFAIDLEEFVRVVWALSSLAVFPAVMAEGQTLGFLIFDLLRRGFFIYPGGAGFLQKALLERFSSAGMSLEKRDKLARSLPKILAMVTLDQAKQNEMSLWSYGPRSLVFPYGESFFCIDLAGVLEFLRRIFTGVRDESIRGIAFENVVREATREIAGDEFEWGPRKLKMDGSVRDEIDLLLRRGDRVYVGECFSYWQPLIYEIGDAKVIAKRVDRIEEKLDQAEATCRFFREHPKGENKQYDYSSVVEFIPIVISPFIEWLPSTSKRYWIDANTPRVMSLDEFTDFILRLGSSGEADRSKKGADG